LKKNHILGLLIISCFVLSLIPVNSASSTYEMDISVNSSAKYTTNGEYFSYLIDQIITYWNDFDSQFQELYNYPAILDIGINSPYWPSTASLPREDFLFGTIISFFWSLESIQNGSLKLVKDINLDLYNPHVSGYSLFQICDILNKIDTAHPFYISAHFKTADDFINGSLNTFLVREINSSLVGGVYDIPLYSEAALANLRSALKWLDFSFNKTFFEEIIKDQINTLLEYEFNDWRNNTYFALLCLDAGEYFSNSTMTNHGMALLDEIWATTDYLDDDDWAGLKFTLALELAEYNITFAKAITDFGLSLAFNEMGEDFLQIIVANQYWHDQLAEHAANVGLRFHFKSFFKLLKLLHEQYPLEGYDLIQEKIMNFFFTLLYYDQPTGIINPYVGYAYAIHENSFGSYYESFTNGYIYEIAAILSQFFDGDAIINDITPPNISLEYNTGQNAVFTNYGIFLPDNYQKINSSTISIPKTELPYVVLKYTLRDNLTGFRNFKITYNNTELTLIHHDISFNLPFYFNIQHCFTTVKSSTDYCDVYFVIKEEVLIHNPTFILTAYDKIGNVKTVNISINYGTAPHTIHPTIYLLTLLIIPISLTPYLLYRRKQLRKNQ